ncbi:anti-sigma factor [Nonomuraea basaltis]|uniref:anti-sigma factor n=1 Tax=Nonomuraea basaltis TaxID=2495887 RepID=UPI00110C572B|nr:anti-sigma factor [Nonomuraea basaltis]TMR91793.1 anti-sigma factor [Nonomuraea basaltis]
MNDELHTLSGAYAVHALPYAEWVLFEEHLRACQGCGAEIRRLRETAARLAETVAEPPPAVLRDRLLAAAHESRRGDVQEERGQPERVSDDSPTIWRPPQTRAPGAAPPAAGQGVAPPPEDSPTLRMPPGQGQEAAFGMAPGQEPVFRTAPEMPVRPEGGGEVVPLRRRRSKVLAGLAAVSAAAAVALGAVAFDARRDLGDLTARNQEMVAVLAAPDARTVRQPVTSGGTGTVVISRSAGRMMFTSSGLPELPDSRAYELWLMGPDGPRPAGLLVRAEGGVTTPVLVAPLREDDRVALTVEPAGGSRKPTTQPILLADLPGA